MRLLTVVTFPLLIVACSSRPLPVDTRSIDAISLQGADKLMTPGGRYQVALDQPAFTMTLEPVAVFLAPDIDKGADRSVPTMREDGNGFPLLVLDENFSDAWEQVLLAVAESRLTMNDQDRALGVIYLNDVEGAAFKASKKKNLNSSIKRYQLSVTKTQLGTEVTVQFGADELADKEASVAILNELSLILSR